MSKGLKILIGGTFLGTLGYLFFVQQRLLNASLKTENVEQDIEPDIEPDNNPLGLEIPEGADKQEYLELVTNLYRELPEMNSTKTIADARFRITYLASIDPKWKMFSEIFNQGTTDVV